MQLPRRNEVLTATKILERANLSQGKLEVVREMTMEPRIFLFWLKCHV